MVEEDTYAFDVAVYEAFAVHVCEAIRQALDLEKNEYYVGGRLEDLLWRRGLQ
jgi:hypothetical protein